MTFAEIFKRYFLTFLVSERNLFPRYVTPLLCLGGNALFSPTPFCRALFILSVFDNSNIAY